MRQKIELYLDSAGEFRWRLLSNRRVIAESGEGYKKKAKAKAGIQAARRAFSKVVTIKDGIEYPGLIIEDLTK